MDVNLFRVVLTLVIGCVGVVGIFLAVDSFTKNEYILGILELFVGIFFCVLAAFIYISPITIH